MKGFLEPIVGGSTTKNRPICTVEVDRISMIQHHTKASSKLTLNYPYPTDPIFVLGSVTEILHSLRAELSGPFIYYCEAYK